MENKEQLEQDIAQAETDLAFALAQGDGYAEDNAAARLAALRRQEAALVAIIDAAQDEPGGLNFANRAAAIAREGLGWEQEAALVAIIDAAQDEPGGLNFANRAAAIAREGLGWEKD